MRMNIKDCIKNSLQKHVLSLKFVTHHEEEKKEREEKRKRKRVIEGEHGSTVEEGYVKEDETKRERRREIKRGNRREKNRIVEERS